MDLSILLRLVVLHGSGPAPLPCCSTNYKTSDWTLIKMVDETNETNDKQKWKDRLTALLLKAEDPACSPQERETIVEKVTYLMAKFGIEEALLKAQEHKVTAITNQRYKMTNPYANAKARMLYKICIIFGCEAISLNAHSRHNDSDNDVLHVFGHEDDQERVFFLYSSLLLQMTNALLKADSMRPKGQHRKSFNHSFVNAFVEVIRERLEVAYNRAKQDVASETTGNGMELALQDRTLAVKNLFNQSYPRVVFVQQNTSTSSAAGRYAGRSAGYAANIGQTTVSGGRRAIGS